MQQFTNQFEGLISSEFPMKYPVVNIQKAIEHDPFSLLIYLWNIVIFHSYVSKMQLLKLTVMVIALLFTGVLCGNKKTETRRKRAWLAESKPRFCSTWLRKQCLELGRAWSATTSQGVCSSQWTSQGTGAASSSNAGCYVPGWIANS